ncbi:MAG: hypothetical protein ACK5RL_07940 [Acidimicrobiales bacterium]
MSSTDSTSFDTARTRREQLGDAMQALAALVDQPVQNPARWQAEVISALDTTRDGIHEHVERAESADGLYTMIRTDAPQLDRQLEQLADEHVAMLDTTAELRQRLDQLQPEAVESEAPAVRSEARSLLETLRRHRERGADLVYKTYHVDIGSNE